MKVEIRSASFCYSAGDNDPTFQDELKQNVLYLQQGTFQEFHPDFHDELKAFAPSLIETMEAIMNQLNSFEAIAKTWISFIQKLECISYDNYSMKLIWHFISNRYHLSNQSRLLERVWKYNKEKMDKEFKKALTEFLNKKLSIKNAGFESENYDNVDEEMEDDS